MLIFRPTDPPKPPQPRVYSLTPTVVRVPRQHTVDRTTKQVMESMQSVGEECIALTMFHPSVDETQPRCSECYDPIYKQNAKSDCSSCFGTTIEGGVKYVQRAWATFTESTNEEKYTKRGAWQPDEREVQIEAFPQLARHDYLVRVKRWDLNFGPLELADRYILGTVTEVVLHAGSRFSQQDIDKVGQKSSLQMLPKNHVIYRYEIPLEIPIPRKYE
jgi:hypothetical protein